MNVQKFCEILYWTWIWESVWNGTEVPEDVLKFFGALFNFSNTDFNRPGSQAQSNDHEYLCQEGIKWLHCSKQSTMLSIMDIRERQCISWMNRQYMRHAKTALSSKVLIILVYVQGMMKYGGIIQTWQLWQQKEATLSGIGGSHDTVSQMHCKQIKTYSKPAKKPIIPSSYEVLDNLYEMDKLNYECIQMKDVTISYALL